MSLPAYIKTRPAQGLRLAKFSWEDPTDAIWFSGFWRQGDWACFEDYWSHAKGANARTQVDAPTDATLHGIADRLHAIGMRNFYQLAAEVSHRGTARPANRRPKMPRRRWPNRCSIWLAGSTASFRPDTTTSPRKWPSRTNTLAPRLGGGPGEHATFEEVSRANTLNLRQIGVHDG